MTYAIYRKVGILSKASSLLKLQSTGECCFQELYNVSPILG